MTAVGARSYLEQVEEFGAHNYHPLPVVIRTIFKKNI